MHFSYFKLQPIEGSSKEVNKKLKDENKGKTINYIQLYLVLNYQIQNKEHYIKWKQIHKMDQVGKGCESVV